MSFPNRLSFYYFSLERINMKNSFYKKIMQDLGMPQSKSLYNALLHVANVAVQETHNHCRKNNNVNRPDACECPQGSLCEFFHHDENCQYGNI